MNNLISSEIEIINEFSKELKEHFVGHIVTAYLFGSRAKQSAKFDSDYDFLIILNERNLSIKEQIYNLAYEFLLRYQADISLKIVPTEQWSEMKNLNMPFYKNIISQGIELWTKKN